MFKLVRKLVVTTGIENSFKNTFLLEKKSSSIDWNVQKIKENVAKSNNKGLYRLLYNLNNGLFFWTEKYFSPNWDV